jgi:hypothetical protein
MKRLLVLLLSSVLASALSAQTVWRCGPDGRSFQSVPCTDGHTVALRAAPGMEAVAEARAVAARERQALAQLSGERREREQAARQRGVGPAGIRPTVSPAPEARQPRKASKKSRNTTKGREPARPTFTASAPRQPAD